jgi:WD40 repeat protein
MTTNAESAESILNKSAGYIEVVSNSHMERFRLPSWQSERIAIDSHYVVGDFDVSRDGSKRVMTIVGFTEDFKLIIYSDQNKVNTISSKAILRNPVFSPDGKGIAYLQARKHNVDWIGDWYLHFTQNDGSVNKQLSSLGLAQFKPSWFPDGKRLAVSTKDYNIYIHDNATNKEIKIIDFGYAPTVSNDGRRIDKKQNNSPFQNEDRRIRENNVIKK